MREGVAAPLILLLPLLYHIYLRLSIHIFAFFAFFRKMRNFFCPYPFVKCSRPTYADLCKSAYERHMNFVHIRYTFACHLLCKRSLWRNNQACFRFPSCFVFPPLFRISPKKVKNDNLSFFIFFISIAKIHFQFYHHTRNPLIKLTPATKLHNTTGSYSSVLQHSSHLS